jgi:membrane-bound lytic murein transglycosylase D
VVLFALALAAGGCARARGGAPALGEAPEPAAGDSVPVARGGMLAAAVPAAPAPDTTRAPRRDSLPVTAAEVAREAARVFGDSAPPPLVDAPAASGTTWDIDVRSFAGQERVAHFVELFTGEARDRFTRRLTRGTRYDAMIRAKLKAGGIPEDMTYLALIESGYDPDAYSRAAAVGMWQFMSSTARGLGLRVDWWVDERRDPVRATDAAVRFINYLRQQFGSMYLAAAAYNGGPGRVARGLRAYADDLEGTTGDSLFFALAGTGALRRETMDYVPQLVAAALVGKEPARYGVRVDSLAPFTYDSVLAPAATPLAAIARAAGVELAAVRELNPGLLRGLTPPDAPWRVRLPAGSATGFDSALAALPDAARGRRRPRRRGRRWRASPRRTGCRPRNSPGTTPRWSGGRRRARSSPASR